MAIKIITSPKDPRALLHCISREISIHKFGGLIHDGGSRVLGERDPRISHYEKAWQSYVPIKSAIKMKGKKHAAVCLRADSSSLPTRPMPRLSLCTARILWIVNSTMAH